MQTVSLLWLMEKISEMGTHEELLALNGVYAKMWQEYQQSVTWNLGKEVRLMLKRLFALSDKGVADLKKGGAASAFSSLSLFVPMGLCLMLLREVCRPLLGETAQIPNIWLYTGLAVPVWLSSFLQILWNIVVPISQPMRKVPHGVSHWQKNLRKLPLSYFGEHDLAEMTTSMMSDCNELERTFFWCHTEDDRFHYQYYPYYDWVVCYGLAYGISLFCVAPVALLLIVGSKKLQDKMGARRMEQDLLPPMVFRSFSTILRILKPAIKQKNT